MSNLSLRDYFAARAMQALITVAGSQGTDVASSAYSMADAMLSERGIGCTSDDEADGESWMVMFIGGPRHGEKCEMRDEPVIECDPGQYHRHFLGLENLCYKMVYVWSELHAEEVVDLVLEAIEDSNEPSSSGNVDVVVADGVTRLTVSDGVKYVTLALDKEAAGLLAEELAKAFNQ